MLRTIVPLVLGAVMLLDAAFAQQGGKPRVPAGSDPGGVAVALFSTGIDYTLPSLAARLARDGEGEPIAWDSEDNDNRPFDKSRGAAPANLGGDTTALASAMLDGAPGIRLVPVRISLSDPVSLGRAVAFVAQTPARIAVVPMASPHKQEWEPFQQAATHFKDVLFVIVAGDTPESAYPAALGLDNVLAVAATTSGGDHPGFGGAPRPVSGATLAIAGAAKAAAGILAREPRLGAKELKRRLIASEGGTTWRARR
jgi:hypothetical protein